MLSVGFKSVARKPVAEQIALVREIVPLMAAEDYPAALRRLLESADFGNASSNPEAIRNAAVYYLSLLFRELGLAEEFDRLAEAHGPLRPDGPPLEFGWHSRLGAQLVARRDAALANGRPSILLFSLEKSASAFLSNLLADMLGLAAVNLDLNDGVLCDHLVAEAARGGCVTHNHVPASEANLALLRRHWRGPVFVQLRDPRAAVWSMFHHANRLVGRSEIEPALSDLYPRFVAFVDAWLAAAERDPAICIVRYDDVAADLPAVVMAILERSGLDPALYPDWIAAQGAPQALNFRSGRADEWRTGIPADLQARYFGPLPERVRALFEERRRPA